MDDPPVGVTQREDLHPGARVSSRPASCDDGHQIRPMVAAGQTAETSGHQDGSSPHCGQYSSSLETVSSGFQSCVEASAGRMVHVTSSPPPSTVTSSRCTRRMNPSMVETCIKTGRGGEVVTPTTSAADRPHAPAMNRSSPTEGKRPLLRRITHPSGSTRTVRFGVPVWAEQEQQLVSVGDSRPLVDLRLGWRLAGTHPRLVYQLLVNHGGGGGELPP